MMMGRGLVEPVDMWHAQNPPSHPELLDLLAESLLKHDYDLQYLLRELALSETYQLSSRHESQTADSASVDDTNYSVALLKPLSPEQLAWSMMQATGVADQQMQSLITRQEKADAKQLASDPIWQEKTLNRALRSNIDAFTRVFGIEGPQHARFDASADQALFLRNGDLVQQWVSRKNGLSDRLAALESGEVAEEFYLSVYSRMPDTDEAKLVEDLLEHSMDRKADIQRLLWAGLTSTEFRFNH